MMGAGEAEWQQGISIWNFNKARKRRDASQLSRHAGVRGVSTRKKTTHTQKKLNLLHCAYACMSNHLIFGALFGGNVDKDKSQGGAEQG